MSTIFKAKDRFKVKDTGATGTVVAPSFNSIYQRTEYYILWDSNIAQGVCCYPEDDVKDIWEKIGSLDDVNHCMSLPTSLLNEISKAFGGPTITLPVGRSDGYSYKINYRGCDHKWVEAGFTSSKIACYNCGIDKP